MRLFARTARSFPCHKVILAAHSDVFQSIIDSKERDSQELKVEIPECADVEVAEHFIKFFYTGIIENDFLDSNLVMLLYLSDFFNVEDLHETVEEKMISKLSRQTVKEFLDTSTTERRSKTRPCSSSLKTEGFGKITRSGKIALIGCKIA